MRVEEGGGRGLEVVQHLPRGEEGGGGPALEEGRGQHLGPGLDHVGGGVGGGEVRVGKHLHQESSTSVQLIEGGREGLNGVGGGHKRCMYRGRGVMIN